MMKVEEKQYHESRIQTRSPMRITNTTTHHEFDNNLDYLLEDLQNSIVRSEQVDNRRHSPARVTSLRPANPTIEYDDSYLHKSPDGAKNVKTVKKEVYSYQSSSGDIPHESSRIRSNINELDSLLDDLQQVKQPPESYKSGSGQQNYREYSKSKVITGKTVVENVYPEPPPITSKTYTSSSVGTDEATTADSQYLNEGTYGNIKTRSSATPPPPSKSSTLSKQTRITNIHSYPVEVVETSTPTMNTEILANLDPNLLPSGNTKVTTTIKTYTYEIPGTVYPSPNANVETEKYVYSPNDSQTTPSKSFVYNKYETNASQQNVNYSTDQQYRSVDNVTSVKTRSSPSLADDRTTITETVSSRNYYPGSTQIDNYGKQAHVYKESTLTRTTGTNTLPYDRPPLSPSLTDDRTIIRETITSRNYQPGPVYPDTSGRQTYVYNDSTLTRTTGTNTDYSPTNDMNVGTQHYPIAKSPPSHGHPPHEYSPSVTIQNITTRRETNYIDDTRNKPPPSQYNVSYNYSEKYKTDTSYDENKPLLHYPNRFPTDADQPPKKLDELMAKIGDEPPNSPLNAGFNAHEIELAQHKKVETLKMQQKEVDKEEQKKLQQTKNVTGPPVYYPPGHEMFSSKSESGGGGWRAEGAMAKESGKYKYEAESKSSTKTKTAVVPVCLPLCCGLPCTIL